MKLLLIDNNDSFTYNLYHLIIRNTGFDTCVLPYDKLPMCDNLEYDAFVISPGPGHPSEYIYYSEIFNTGKPVFGVCLGMQIINLHFAGEVTRLEGCRHGVTLPAEYNKEFIDVAVYNSLYCSLVPDVFEIISKSVNVPMWIKHKEQPIAGVQFHPESFLTKNGGRILTDAFSSIGII
ncbi:MAG: type 1 glutamine amidotransferase [Denitrovibrio sp.]|nr:MAG: type 1 glutamine amidotransferase [Denitrovibrio sp.]